MPEFIIVTFYKLTPIKAPKDIQYKLTKLCTQLNIKGTILLAEEGINATVAGNKNSIKEFCYFLKSIPEFYNITFQESKDNFIPFKKMKVKIKEEIITFKVKNLDMNNTGEYLNSNQWHEFIKQDDVLLIDNRNYYEVAIGTFKGAIDPETYSFSELAKWFDKNLASVEKDQKIAMFCTGGVRCEKSTGYLKQKGFKNVYHLKGGILKYLKDFKGKEESLWEGQCFIFDDRIHIE